MFDLTALMAGASAGLAEEEDGLAKEEAGFVDFEVDATGGEGERGRGRGLFEGERSASCFEISARRKLSEVNGRKGEERERTAPLLVIVSSESCKRCRRVQHVLKLSRDWLRPRPSRFGGWRGRVRRRGGWTVAVGRGSLGDGGRTRSRGSCRRSGNDDGGRVGRSRLLALPVRSAVLAAVPVIVRSH